MLLNDKFHSLFSEIYHDHSNFKHIGSIEIYFFGYILNIESYLNQIRGEYNLKLKNKWLN